MKKFFCRSALYAAIAFSLLPCHAQQTTATLLGTVTDASGSSVSGVVVKATNLATSFAREGLSDASGAYSIRSLPAGAYRVTASRAGFQAQQIDNIVLQVEQSARVDINLKVGNVSETVNVSASGAQDRHAQDLPVRPPTDGAGPQ
jgi:hypothetical protein